VTLPQLRYRGAGEAERGSQWRLGAARGIAGTARVKASRLGSKRGAPGRGGPRTEKAPAARPRARQ